MTEVVGLIGNMKKAAGYIRVSTKGQATEGESLSTQRAAIEDYASRNGWTLSEIYADEGISGGSMKKRTALQRLLRDAKTGNFKVLIIHRTSGSNEAA